MHNLFGIISSSFRSAVSRFSSLYESFAPLTSVINQHFVEWFSGSALDTNRWTYKDIDSSSTVGTISDEINGGYNIQTGTPVGARCSINFNNKRQFSPTASEIIGVVKGVSSADQGILLGFINGTDPITEFEQVLCGYDTAVDATKFFIRTGDASTNSSTSGSVNIDANFHVIKIKCGSSDIKSYIDGVLDVTKTTNRPTAKLQPTFYAITRINGSAKNGRIRYVEAYNTTVSILSSLYERLSALTQVMGQRVIEHFSGSGLDTNRWTHVVVSGTDTSAMSDSIDGGYSIATSTSSTNNEIYNAFNNKRQYDYQNAVCICVAKMVNTTNNYGYWGFFNTLTPFTGSQLDSSFVQAATPNNANYTLQTGDASTQTGESSGVAIDTNFHVFKIENGSSNIKLYIDGVLKVTKTTNRPTQKQQLKFGGYLGGSGTTLSTLTRYLEAYNKLTTETSYPSVYELFNPLTTVAKQRFWDWFSGNALDTNRWTETTVGSSTVAIDDNIDGGIIITSGSSGGDRKELTFNNKRQYDYDGSVSICVMKTNSLDSCAIRSGFINATLAASTSASLGMFDTYYSTYFVFNTGNSGGSTTTTSSVTADTNYHTVKVENNVGNSKLYIDGVLAATNTTYLPNLAMQPHISGQTRTNLSKTSNFRYFEAYNT